jgi:hypothetical protein
MTGAIAFSMLCALGAPAGAVFSGETSVVRVDVAASRDGVPLSGLQADDFELLDNGVVQTVSVAAAGRNNIHAVLVMDLSDSLSADDRHVLRRDAAAFLGRLGRDDRATLLAFTQEVKLVCGPDLPSIIVPCLSDLEGGGTTALYDAIIAGLLVSPAAPGRPVVVVLTDGVDRISWTREHDLQQAARMGEATLHFVSTASRPAARDHSFLSALAADTGGHVWDGSMATLEGQFARVLAEVQRRYLLVYEPTHPTPGWHDIQVRLTRQKGDVIARRGYVSDRR